MAVSVTSWTHEPITGTAPISPLEGAVMSLFLYRLGRVCARRRGLVLSLWGLAAAGIVALAAVAGGSLGDDISIPGSETDAATALLKERFPAFAGGSATVVFRGEPGFLQTPRGA